jgi:epoxyqueuosine reductase
MAQKTVYERYIEMNNSAIEELLTPFQVDYIGYADLSTYQNELYLSGGNIVKEYSCGISIGIIIPNSIVDFLPERSNMDVACQYRIQGYDIINNRLNTIASILASYLNKNGYRTLPITAADRDSKKTNGIISHKMIAHIAGMGWIGKSCLLITPKNGPRVRFVSILTDAPLKTVNSPIEQKCGTCRECQKICPVNAIIGRNYIQGEEREKRFEYDACYNYFEEMKINQQYSVCGMCLFICPYGRK